MIRKIHLVAAATAAVLCAACDTHIDAVSYTHLTVHTGRKPDGNHSKRTDNGGLLAKQLLLRRLLDGGKYRGTEMPKPRAGLGSMDDT